MQLVQDNKIHQSHHQICVILENTQNSDTTTETALETKLNNLRGMS